MCGARLLFPPLHPAPEPCPTSWPPTKPSSTSALKTAAQDPLFIETEPALVSSDRIKENRTESIQVHCK